MAVVPKASNATRERVLELLRAGNLRQADIARRVGRSRARVGQLVREFQRRGLLA